MTPVPLPRLTRSAIIKAMMSMVIRVGCAVSLALAPAAEAAEPARLFGTNPRTDQRLTEAAALAKGERWPEAVDLYVRIADEAGNELVASVADKRHFIPVRTFVQQCIGRRPEMIDRYRQRFEGRMQRTLDAAEPHDPTALMEIVGSGLCTRAAATALHRLGDLACEGGDFATARRWWTMLLPPARSGQLVHPDPGGDPALVRAKLILAKLLSGDTNEGRADLEGFRRNHSAATGYIAGSDGNLLATLERLLDRPTTAIAVGNLRPPEPTTFGLDASHNAVITGRLPDYAPEVRFPPVPLPEASLRSDDRLTPQMLVKPGALAFHPLVMNRRVFVADGVGITAFSLESGTRLARLTLDRATHRLPVLDTKLPSNSDVRYSLTAAGDRLFARFGQPRIRVDRADADSYLVCVRVTADGGLKLAWSLPALKRDEATVSVWEGTPVVGEGRLYAAVTRLDGNRAITAVACYDPSEPQPSLLWQHDVLEAGAETSDRTQHLLLTLAGPLVVCGPHAGVIVALDAATGKRAWATRYESNDPKAGAADAPFRELGPCVAAGGVLYAAPADAERVYAFDAGTGAPLWESDSLSLAHLLGVTRGLVVGQRSGPVAGLTALDASTGRIVPGWGYAVFAGEDVAPFGRGLIAGDRVYWPTRAAGVRELHLDGTVELPPTSFQSLPGGNLVYGEGGLVVATEDRLHVLLPPIVEAGVPAVKREHGTFKLVTLRRGEATRDSSAPPGPAGDAALARPRRADGEVISLEPGREWAFFCDGFDESCFVVSPGGLARCDWPDGRETWKRTLTFFPDWAAGVEGVAVVGGSSDVVGVDCGTGRVLWHEAIGQVAPREKPGWQDRFWPVERQPRLHDFCVRDGSVALRLGEQLTVTLDVRTGRSISGPSTENDIVRRDGMSFGAGDRQLAARVSATGQLVWERGNRHRIALSSERPRLRLVGGDLLTAVPRNDGFEVERLDPKTGGPRPGKPFSWPGNSFDLSAVAVVGNYLLVAADGKLMSWDGDRVAWRMPFGTPGPWRLEPVGDWAMAAWPVPSPATPPLTKLPVVVVSAADGRVVARWEFGRPGAHSAVRVANGHLCVATEGEVRRVSAPARREVP